MARSATSPTCAGSATRIEMNRRVLEAPVRSGRAFDLIGANRADADARISWQMSL